MSDNHQVEVLLALFLDDIASARHHEGLRSTVANLTLVVGAAAGAFVGFDAKISMADLPAAALLIIVGVFGAMLSHKHYYLFHFHRERARPLREKLDQLTGLGLTEMKVKSDANTAARYPHMKEISAGFLWTIMPLSVSILGIAIAVAAVCA